MRDGDDDASGGKRIGGGCLRGGMRYVIEGAVDILTLCHCSRCRKAQGAAFGPFVRVAGTHFRYESGEELLQLFRISPTSGSAFCRRCGSNMPYVGPETSVVAIPAGTLDDDPGVKPALHQFVASKAPWYEITDDLPQFQEAVPVSGRASGPDT